jgi:probable rRNA maturation factor
MRKIAHPRPKLSLAIQYAVQAQELPRWRLRRWVLQAIKHAQLAQSVRCIELTLRLVGDQESQELNRTYRGKDYATNVLTFPYEPITAKTPLIAADLVMCTTVLQTEAREQKKTYRNHAAHLVIHATLHALGYDHEQPQEAQHMEALEVQILKTLKIPDPYQISRST